MANRPNKKFKKIEDDFMPQGDPNVLKILVTDAGLSEDTVLKLQSVELNDICDIAKCQMRHLYRIPDMTKRNIFEVLRKLQSYNLDFRQPPNRSLTEDGENDTKIENDVNSEADLTATNVVKNRGLRNTKGQIDKAKTVDENKGRKPNNQNAKNENDSRDEKTNNQNVKTEKGFRDRNPNSQNNPNSQKERVNGINVDGREVKRNGNNRIQSDMSAPSKLGREKINTRDFEKGNFNNRSNNKHDNRDNNFEPEKKEVKRVINLPPLKNPDGMYKFYKQGKWGYKDEQGKVVIQPMFDEAFNFSEGYACIEVSERVGFIDKTGEVVIPVIFDTACSFSEGLASVTKDGKCGYINYQNEVVFDFIYDAATPFINNVSLVKKEGKWGYMSRETGEIRLR